MGGAAAQAEELAAQLRRAECDAGAHEADMAVFERDHADIDTRVERLEAELSALRQRRIEAYARWWNAREDRDRSLHIARRLRRRLERTRRRLRYLEGYAGG
ncbi:chromosome segregation ATPase [Lipingzhangella halophila]|uniref:Chromosome segregation ATPase n=2 Tax=Lipingzhangella halophila TaxID=1783352 RepID=A0A7W7RDU1_9ACTN|nr:hypothetical protein [Lipingzhangella halophila]MBB4930172.1 chromosome segregation ATPase [Lipingzhangella halophila]